MLGSPHSSNGGSNGDGNGLSSVGPPMTPLPPGNEYFIGKLFKLYKHLITLTICIISCQNVLKPVTKPAAILFKKKHF